MNSKKNNHHGFKILFTCFFIIVFLFFLYEWLIIGNPFFDPIQASWLWLGLLIATSLFAFRIFHAFRS